MNTQTQYYTVNFLENSKSNIKKRRSILKFYIMLNLKAFESKTAPALESIVGGRGDYKVVGTSTQLGHTFEDWEFDDGQVICDIYVD